VAHDVNTSLEAGGNGGASARELVLERDLVVRALPPFLGLGDLMRLSRTNAGCLREVRQGLRALGETLIEMDNLTDADVSTIVRCFPNLRSLDVGNSEKVTDEGLREICRRLPGLRELNTMGCKVTEAGIAALPETLESLGLGDYTAHGEDGGETGEKIRLTDACLIATVRRLPNLHTLDLSFAQGVSDESLRVIGETLPHLRSFMVSYNHHNVTHVGVAYIAKGCKGLEAIDLGHC